MLIIHPTLTHSRSLRTLILKKFDANTAVRIWKRPRWISIVFSPYTVLYHLNINNGHYRHFHFFFFFFILIGNDYRGIPEYVGTALLFLIDLNVWTWINWSYTSTTSENIPSRQESERRCLHWTPANKASISSYIHTNASNACSAMLFTLIKVVRSIDVCDDWTAWMLGLSSWSLPYPNWNVKFDWSHNSI